MISATTEQLGSSGNSPDFPLGDEQRKSYHGHNYSVVFHDFP
jgi:hypothetical protein